MVSIFSTGVVEAAARGLPAWVTHPLPPAWLQEFWDRYGMSRWGTEPTPAPVQPAGEPARLVAERLADLAGGVMTSPPAPAAALSTLCVIPRRGGSKGIPRKNLLPVAGKPLIVWTIEQALRAATPMQVLVSTDDAEIAEVARAAGAQVPFLRPTELAQDTTATEPVVLHAIEAVSAAGRDPDQVMLLQATSPIRLADTLDRALDEFAASGADSMVGVVPQAPFLWWAGRTEQDPPRADYDVARRPLRQDLTRETLRFRETGSLYLTRTDIYREHRNRLGGRIVLFEMAEVEGVDIDTDIDLRVTEGFLLAHERDGTNDGSVMTADRRDAAPTATQDVLRGRSIDQ